MKLFLGVSYNPLGCPFTPANNRPPRTLSVGTSAIGLVYLARAAASMGCTKLGSKPVTLRLYRSVRAPSNSYLRPRFIVSLGVTFQSSWTKKPQVVDCSAKSAARVTPLAEVGRPSRKAANDNPTLVTPFRSSFCLV